MCATRQLGLLSVKSLLAVADAKSPRGTDPEIGSEQLDVRVHPTLIPKDPTPMPGCIGEIK